jgi:hypothetical protein
MNGLYAGSRALHVFPATAEPDEYSLQRWNQSDLWRCDYGDLANGLVFFGEDLFGDQFAIDGEEVVSFKAETGERHPIAESIGGWLTLVLADTDVLTGRPVAELWERERGPLSPGTRLTAITPFVMGGSYELETFESSRPPTRCAFAGS